eukprot:GILK01011551.1.p1 GENE.GILK01011551.1~~GILK01011551.1.p1  ORF type:complete len:243 (+),score=22.21 GILK01011551.1:137-865(+)
MSDVNRSAFQSFQVPSATPSPRNHPPLLPTLSSMIQSPSNVALLPSSDSHIAVAMTLNNMQDSLRGVRRQLSDSQTELARVSDELLAVQHFLYEYTSRKATQEQSKAESTTRLQPYALVPHTPSPTVKPPVYVPLPQHEDAQGAVDGRGAAAVPDQTPKRKTPRRATDGLCVSCGATETPQWRIIGENRYCNACGLGFLYKDDRRHSKYKPEDDPQASFTAMGMDDDRKKKFKPNDIRNILN